jgi:hypothetical protein
MPFTQLIENANHDLTERGYQPLDALNGRIGVSDHGVWDFTWVAHRRFGPLCYASLFAWPAGGNRYTVEVWARLEGTLPNADSLVAHADDLRDPPSRSRIVALREALQVAATRALRLSDLQTPQFLEQRVEDYAEPTYEAFTGAGLVRIPYPSLIEIVADVVSSEPQHLWTNQEVLSSVLQRGFPTDRADINTVLAGLAEVGRLERVSRGHYRARLH